jgi:futalosine hydrolase
MKILLVSATYKEIEGTLLSLENQLPLAEGFFRGFSGEVMTDIIITGPGSVNTAIKLTSRLENVSYDLVLNAGICGSFRKDIEPGTAVNIISETWGDLGADDKGTFLDLFDLGFADEGKPPFSGRKMLNPGSPYSEYFNRYLQVNGITVNKAHGEKNDIEKCIVKFHPDVESMEGASIFSICIPAGLNFQCLRTVSNFVEPRNRSAWKTELALNRLTEEINFVLSVAGK